MLKMKITTPKILPHFPTTSEIFAIIDKLNIVKDYFNNDDQFTRLYLKASFLI